jgi:hypothetical protein
MVISFTRHALYRLRERGILESEAVDTILHPDIVIKQNEKHFFRKRLSRGIIEVCCQKTADGIKIITVYWI